MFEGIQDYKKNLASGETENPGISHPIAFSKPRHICKGNILKGCSSGLTNLPSKSSQTYFGS